MQTLKNRIELDAQRSRQEKVKELEKLRKDYHDLKAESDSIPGCTWSDHISKRVG